MDAMSEATLDALRTGDKKKIDKTRTKEEICLEKLYTDKTGVIGIPVQNLFAALNGGARFVGFDAKRKLATAKSTLLPTIMAIKDKFIPLQGGAEWVADQRRGRLADGTAVAVVRPRFDEWGFEFTIELDDDENIKIDKIEEVIVKAGRAQGLGSFRPDCKGNFGMFDVVSCTEIK